MICSIHVEELPAGLESIQFLDTARTISFVTLIGPTNRYDITLKPVKLIALKRSLAATPGDFGASFEGGTQPT